MGEERLQESRKRLKEMSFEQIIAFQNGQLDKMEDAVKRKDEATFRKIYQWYLDSLKVMDFTPRYRARADAIGDKADKVKNWK